MANMREPMLALREEVRFFARTQLQTALSMPRIGNLILAVDSPLHDADAASPSFRSGCRRSDPALQWVLSAPAGGFQHPNRPFRRTIPRPVAAPAKTGKAPTILAGTPHGPGAAMSITDFLFSLHKLLAWLLALLTVLLPQHLLGPLPAADATAAVPAATTQLCMQTPVPPRKLARAALPPSNADEAGAAATASENPDPASPSRTKQ